MNSQQGKKAFKNGWWQLVPDYGKTYDKPEGQEPIATQPQYCESCRRQWQLSVKGRKKSLSYFYNLPSIGKERKTCPECDD